MTEVAKSPNLTRQFRGDRTSRRGIDHSTLYAQVGFCGVILIGIEPDANGETEAAVGDVLVTMQSWA